MIDTYARIIFDDMDGSTFEPSVDSRVTSDIHSMRCSICLRHIPYPSGSYKVCLFVQIVLIERMSLVVKFLGLHHVLLCR